MDQGLVVVLVALVATVGVGRIDQGDAEVEDPMQDRQGLRLGRPTGEGQVHGAESQGANFDCGISERRGLHIDRSGCSHAALFGVDELRQEREEEERRLGVQEADDDALSVATKASMS